MHQETTDETIFDGLTGLYRRRQFLELLQREVDAARRSCESVSILLVDIDHLKRINDDFGFSVGDCVIRDVAALVKTLVREPEGYLGRTGDETHVLLPRTNIVSALRRAETIRQLIDSSDAMKLLKWQVTVSIGVATSPCAGDWNCEELCDLADGRLQGAKNNGRNNILARDNSGVHVLPRLAQWPSVTNALLRDYVAGAVEDGHAAIASNVILQLLDDDPNRLRYALRTWAVRLESSLAELYRVDSGLEGFSARGAQFLLKLAEEVGAQRLQERAMTVVEEADGLNGPFDAAWVSELRVEAQQVLTVLRTVGAAFGDGVTHTDGWWGL